MSEETIKLGLMPPITGLVGIYGSEIVHAAQVACQEVNEKGGVLGRPLELIIEDDGSLPESAVTAAEKLIDEHQCTAIIGNLLSNSRIAVAYRVAEPRKVPYLNFSFYEGSIVSPYFFHFAALPNQQIDKMIPYMCNKFGPRMFFAGNNYEWPRGSIHAGKLALEKAGGEVVGEEYTPIGIELDVIEKLLDHVEAANPDVFVPYFAGDDQVLLLTRFTERGLKNRIAVVMGHYDEMMASQLPAEVREGFYSSNTYFMTIDSEENKNYKSRLANLPDVNGVWPEGNGILTNFGEGTYVCVKAFAEAANMAGTLDSEVLVEELDAIRINAPQGIVEMNPEHHHAKVNTYLSQCDAKGVFNIIENFGAIEPEIPARYRHQQIASQATLEDDIRLQARILEQMTDGVILTSSADGTIVYANTGAEKLFGYDKDEMVGLPIASINDSTDNNPHDTAEEIIRILNQTGEWQGEIHNIKKDGTPVWCSATVSTFTHPAYGEVWLAVHHEITQIKNTETALRESESQLKEAQRIAKVGGWKLDIVGNHLIWTDETYHIFEIDKEDFNDAYESFLNRVHPDDVSRVEKAFTDSLKNHEPYEIEHRILMKDGRIKFVLETCETKYSKDGAALYSTGIVQDITERVEQENALRGSEERFQLAVTGSNDGIWDWNIATGSNYFSPRFIELLGYSADDEFPQTMENFSTKLHPDDKDRVLKAVNQHLEEHKPYDIEYQLQMKDGTYKWFLARGQAIWDQGGNPIRMAGSVSDISNRKLAEEKLTQSEARFRSVFESKMVGIVFWDATGELNDANDIFLEMVGYTRDEVISRDIRWRDMTPPEYKEQDDKGLEEIATVGVMTPFEKEYLHKDGSRIPVLLGAAALPGDELHGVAFVMDIRERKSTEKALKESEGLLAKAQTLAKVGHWKLIPDIGEVTGSDELFKIFGFSSDKASLETFVEVVHPDDREMDITAIQRGIEHGESWDIEHRLVCRDGTEKWVHAIGEAFTDESGKVVELLGTVQDISEVKFVELALRKSEEEYRILIESSHEVIFSKDKEGYYHTANLMAANGLGLATAEELEGKSDYDLMPKEKADELREADKKVMEGAKLIELEEVVPISENEFRTYLSRKWPTYDKNGNVSGIVCFAMDITDSKKIELELEKYRENLEELVEARTKELQEAQDELVRKERLATLGQLTATVSHELRNPLGAMRPSLYVIEKKIDKEDVRVKKAVERIDRNIDRCDRIIDELLDYTRIIELNREVIRVDEWLGTVIDEQVIPDGISLEKNFSLNNIKLDLDTERLRRAIINVFDNACHSMMDDNQQLVTNKKNAQIMINAEIINQRFEFCITDTGIGIKENVLTKVFEPLFSTKGFGVGLGMPTVKQIMEQHGGGVEIESEEGKGTTVTLWLPKHSSDSKGDAV